MRRQEQEQEQEAEAGAGGRRQAQEAGAEQMYLKKRYATDEESRTF